MLLPDPITVNAGPTIAPKAALGLRLRSWTLPRWCHYA